ncbi:MAG TPA: TIGR01777 family oxidoreductase [Solirubrobacteraceae bacterium]|nr:TIGR01777 family oxidoreductase [Solirubrobacteraceae bacterium]
MRVVVTGATGMIGRSLVSALLARGEEVVALSRDAERGRRALDDRVSVYAWADPLAEPPPADALTGADAVVHLIGEPVAQRWSDEAKEAIRESRVASTRSLVQGLLALAPDARPSILVSQSATGYYGPRGSEPVLESTAAGEPTPAGNDFLAGVVVAWEREALAASSSSNGAVRVVVTRTGVVLSPSGGALAKMLPFFRLGIGGPVAGGRQYVPWVHLDDVVGAMAFCLGNHDATGPVNLTAPTPATNTELSRALGRVLKRPAFLPVPALALKALYGEMAEIVVTGQRAVPARLEELGYHFRYPELEPALRDVLDRPA